MVELFNPTINGQDILYLKNLKRIAQDVPRFKRALDDCEKIDGTRRGAYFTRDGKTQFEFDDTYINIMVGGVLGMLDSLTRGYKDEPTPIKGSILGILDEIVKNHKTEEVVLYEKPHTKKMAHQMLEKIRHNT